MQRIPVSLISNLQLTTALAGATYTTPGNTAQPSSAVTTINSFMLNNTTATPRTVTIHIVPFGQTANAANQVASALAVPAAGSAPTVVSSLVGQHLPVGWSLQMLADAAASITPMVSGYLTTL